MPQVTKSEYPHVTLWSTSKHLLEQGSQEKAGSSLKFMSSMLMSALCWEAFLNYLGQEEIEFWEDLERRLSPNEKLNVLSKHLIFEIDKGQRPFQTIGTVIKFRNAVAHAKPMINETFDNVDLKKNADGVPTGIDELSNKKTKWLTMINEANAERFIQDVEDAAKRLYNRANNKGNPFVIAGTATWWGS